MNGLAGPLEPQAVREEVRRLEGNEARQRSDLKLTDNCLLSDPLLTSLKGLRRRGPWLINRWKLGLTSRCH